MQTNSLSIHNLNLTDNTLKLITEILLSLEDQGEQ